LFHNLIQAGAYVILKLQKCVIYNSQQLLKFLISLLAQFGLFFDLLPHEG